MRLEFLGSLEIPLPQQQLAFVPVQLRCEPALPGPFDDAQRIVQQGQTLLNLPRDLTYCGPEGRIMRCENRFSSNVPATRGPEGVLEIRRDGPGLYDSPLEESGFERAALSG